MRTSSVIKTDRFPGSLHFGVDKSFFCVGDPAWNPAAGPYNEEPWASLKTISS